MAETVAPLEGVTIGEVYRLQLAQSETLSGIKESIEKRPTWHDIERLQATRDKEQAIQDQAIKALEDANRWLTRTVIGALITALGALAVAIAVAGLKSLGA